MTKLVQLKKDKYKSARGGHSRVLNLHCRECDTVFAVYQKDGPGNLLRLYMDRIMAPERLVGLHKKNIKDILPLKCPGCACVVGMPYMYKKEKRNAFRVFQDAVVKRIRKLDN